MRMGELLVLGVGYLRWLAYIGTCYRTGEGKEFWIEVWIQIEVKRKVKWKEKSSDTRET